jgi:hypothetical protein
VAISPVLSRNKNIILIEKKRMKNPITIIVSLQEGQEGLNIVRRVLGFGNHKGLTNDTIAVERQKR